MSPHLRKSMLFARQGELYLEALKKAQALGLKPEEVGPAAGAGKSAIRMMGENRAGLETLEKIQEWVRV